MNQAPSTAAPRVEGAPWRRWLAWTLADDQRALNAASVLLFLVAAWPLLLVQVLPYQDLPNHLASVHVLWHPERYPELVSNGFFKTNAALFAWLYVAGKPLGLHLAAKLFTVVVMAAAAVTYPRLVFELTGSRARALTACLFLWPMIGNWWVLMGMLDYALALPLSLWILLLAARNWRAPTPARSVVIALVAIACWYTHAFALLVAGLLLVIEATRLRETAPGAFAEMSYPALLWRYLRTVLLPLLPVSALLLLSIVLHLTEPEGAMTGEAHLTRMLPAWELAYHLWAEWCCGFGWRTLGSFAVVIGGVWGLTRLRTPIAFFSPRAVVLLGLLYLFTPYSLTNWFHVSSRFVPYLWFGLLVRVPDRLPKALVAFMLLAATSFTVGHGVEYRLLDRDRQEMMVGLDAVPRGARMLPLLFTRKMHSEHTQNLLHAWGYYVIERDVSAPLLFAHSRGFPVMYREAPQARFNHLVLESFPVRMRTPRAFCERGRENAQIIHDDCQAEYRSLLVEFWRAALPTFDTLMVWDMPDEVRASIPDGYAETFHQGKLSIFRRVP